LKVSLVPLVGFLSSRWKLISVLNLLFFGLALGIGPVAGLVFPPQVYAGQSPFVFPEPVTGNPLLMVLFIFAFSLAVSAFLVVTLPGLVFFPLSAVALGLRALLWGLLLYPLPLWYFLAALPTVVLEGEAYVLASAVGVTVGFSGFKRRKELSWGQARIDALRDSVPAYILVAAILLVSAVVESATLLLM